jgi:thiol-disulfide isomerase/thioredoxin
MFTKFINLLIVANLLAIQLNAQKRTVICGAVKANGKFIVNLYEPINGYYNSFYDDTTATNSVLVNGRDSIFKAVKIDRAAFYCIRFTDERGVFMNRIDVLMLPGDSLNLHFDLRLGNPAWVRYKGTNAAGQFLFNQINYAPYDKFVPVLTALSKLPVNRSTFIAEINNCVSNVMSRFDTLKTSGQISPKFRETMQLCFKLIFYEQVIDKFTGNYKQRDVINKAERDSILDVLTAQMPDGADASLKGLYNADVYLKMYFGFLSYKKYKLNSTEELYESNKEYLVNGQKYILNRDISALTYIEDKRMREDLWAFMVLDFIKFVPNNPNEPLIEQFCSIFPDNHWEKYLRNELKTYSSGIKKITYQLQSPIVLVDSTKNIGKLADLVKELPKGKPVFIDLWATWCGPCVDAFSANKPMDSLLLAKNINRLYISLDKQTDKKRWKEAINKYCLGGYHVLANETLMSDIKQSIHISKTVGAPLFIPRYLLINSKGTIVINDAITPLNFASLKEQIEKGLQQSN